MGCWLVHHCLIFPTSSLLLSYRTQPFILNVPFVEFYFPDFPSSLINIKTGEKRLRLWTSPVKGKTKSIAKEKCIKISFILFATSSLALVLTFSSPFRFYRFPTHHHHFAIFILGSHRFFPKKPHEKHISLQNCFIDFSDKKLLLLSKSIFSQIICVTFLSRLIWGMK